MHSSHLPVATLHLTYRPWKNILAQRSFYRTQFALRFRGLFFQSCYLLLEYP